jgi:ABC-2 type transport system ATP-binding protein
VLAGSRVQLVGETDDLLAQHHRLVCTRRTEADLPAGIRVVRAEHTERQSTFIVRCETELPAGDWAAERLGLEDLVLTYMERGGGAHTHLGDGTDTGVETDSTEGGDR